MCSAPTTDMKAHSTLEVFDLSMGQSKPEDIGASAQCHDNESLKLPQV